MNFSRNKFVRFKEASSERSSSPDQQFYTEYGQHQRGIVRSVNAVLSSIRDGVERGTERFKSLKKPLKLSSLGPWPAKKTGSKKKVLDPQGPFLQKWNKIFVLSCVIAVSLDPLFFYIPVIDGKQKCLKLDEKLQIIACVLRTFFDLFYLLHIIFEFFTGFIAPSSRVFGRGELIDDRRAIANRYLYPNFIIDILAILPLPQIAVIIVIPMVDGPVSLVTKDMLEFVIFTQLVPRLLRIYPLFKEVTRTSGIFAETAWAGAAINLFLYMLASHIVGAFWYLFSIERQDKCWRSACAMNSTCNVRELYCDQRGPLLNFTNGLASINASCQLLGADDKDPHVGFNFGIFLDALQSQVVESNDFLKKFFYCFWWGLRNLSSLGQNLKTSTYVWEIYFAIFIAIFGLVLFSLLIGNMQKYLASTTVRVEDMRVRRQDAEQWMSHRMLPENLRQRIKQYEHYKWQETRGVEEETLIRNLPKDLRRDIKRHLCLALLMRVPLFEKMDAQLLDALCDRLKPMLYTEKSFIVREGDVVDEMIFIMRGNIVTTTTNGGRSGFFNSVHLKAGDFCGEELLTWALDPNSSSNLPTSTRTVQAESEVEAFALMADDLKSVASQFRRLHSKHLQQTFKFYSLQWRTWGVCFIQAAWRRHCKRKLDKALREAEDRLQDALASDAVGASPSLGATIYASKFAANALRALRESQKGSGSIRLQQRLPTLLPQKPTEPDFTVADPSL